MFDTTKTNVIYETETSCLVVDMNFEIELNIADLCEIDLSLGVINSPLIELGGDTIMFIFYLFFGYNFEYCHDF